MIKLSGGLKRRFMVAKALIHKPKLLILAERDADDDTHRQVEHVALHGEALEFLQHAHVAFSSVQSIVG
jgi:ABC-type molybdenum transport system ATPase subunit/photorepair protein PhrA